MRSRCRSTGLRRLWASEAMLHVILFVTLTCVILRNQDLILPYLR